MTEETPEFVEVKNVGHVFDLEGGLGTLERQDGSPASEVIFVSLKGINSDGDEYVHFYCFDAFMAMRLAALASNGAVTLTEHVAQHIVARRLEEQNTKRAKDNRGYL